MREIDKEQDLLNKQNPPYQEVKGGQELASILCYFPVLARITSVTKEPVYSKLWYTVSSHHYLYDIVWQNQSTIYHPSK